MGKRKRLAERLVAAWDEATDLSERLGAAEHENGYLRGQIADLQTQVVDLAAEVDRWRSRCSEFARSLNDTSEELRRAKGRRDALMEER